MAEVRTIAAKYDKQVEARQVWLLPEHETDLVTYSTLLKGMNWTITDQLWRSFTQPRVEAVGVKNARANQRFCDPH